MNKHKPKVSIGLPVYNGEQYLSFAIDSILTQNFHDFELIICDNASTDRTEEICRNFVKRDSRIRYIRHDENLGAAPNFNYAFENSTGQYFKWVAHDDVYSPDYLTKCVMVLENDPSVVLCHSRISFIDNSGEIIRRYEEPLRHLHTNDPSKRFKDLINLNHWCLDIFGLMRSKVLKQTRLIDVFYGADRHLLVEMGLRGRFHRIPEYLFFSREHDDRSIRNLRTVKARAKWINTRSQSVVLYVHWKYLREYFRSLTTPKISTKYKLLCYLNLVKWVKHNWWHLKDDIMYAKQLDSSHIFKYKRKM